VIVEGATIIEKQNLQVKWATEEISQNLTMLN
jgi:hypothetical protein